MSWLPQQHPEDSQEDPHHPLPPRVEPHRHHQQGQVIQPAIYGQTLPNNSHRK